MGHMLAPTPWLILHFLAAHLLAAAPSPPPDLKAWVDYARALRRDDGCPPEQPCVQLSRIETAGQAQRGEMTLTFVGNNLGKRPQDVFLVGPASAVSVRAPRFGPGRGSVRLEDKGWVAQVQPGPFTLSVLAQFDPAPSVELDLGHAVAQVVDKLSGSQLVYDDSSAQHGGSVSVESAAAGERQADQAPVSTRVGRAVHYGSVVTFTYHFTVSGLREQTRLDLPMLGDESVESVEPALPYTAGEDSIAVTFTPGSAQVTVTGHFNHVPETLRKPNAEPYETWVLTSDPRHPVQWRCEGMEIDGSEVRDLPVPADGRVFLLQETQGLRMEPVPVNVEAGRQGAGNLSFSFEQGADDAWMGELTLAFTTAPNTDRLLVPTPQPPHYAERGSTAVRLFGDEKNLSLRVDDTQPIRVQWRDALPTNPLFAWLRLVLPGQHVHLDQAAGQVALQPGYVPLAVLGVEHANGDLVEGVQLYGVLIGLLGVALAQAARFPRWACAIVAVLLVGLWAVEDFPREMILVLLAGSAVITRVPTGLLEGLRQRRRTHRVLTLVWVFMGLGTLAPCLEYCSERLLAAMHPWIFTRCGSVAACSAASWRLSSPVPSPPPSRPT